MSDANNEQLRPPPSWEKFEEMCADLFARIWGDPHTVRYGRQGQSQNGVDVYGNDRGSDVGVQCKGKRNWPPTKLTTGEIDAEVEAAKKFRPKLKTYIFVTTAENDVHVIDHVNAVSAAHRAQGLFTVVVYGWGELVRRFYDYPDLLEKHFGIYTLRRMQASMPDEVADRVVERLQNRDPAINPNAPERSVQLQPPLTDSLAEALTRDFQGRFERILQRSMFIETHKTDEFAPLALEILEPAIAGISNEVRKTILFRAARSAATHGSLEEARRFLSAGQSISGDTSDACAMARIAVAEQRVDDAIQLLRDRTDADSRSVLLSILATKRSDDEALRWLADNHVAVTDLTPLGLMNLCQIHLRKEDMGAASAVLSRATSNQLESGIYLYFLRGALHFAQLLPIPEQAIALSGLPVEVLKARPIVTDPELSKTLDVAIADLRQALSASRGLGLRQAPRLIESYILWCELLHPGHNISALAKLRADMQDNALAPLRVQYAFAYDPDYSSVAFEEYLQRRDALGGLSDDELRAAFSVRLNKSDARGLAALVAAKRQQAENIFGKDGVVSLEIQALARSGDATSAAILLENNQFRFEPNQIAGLKAEIAKAQGADPVAEHLRLYESEKSPETLRALVAALVGKSDHIGIGKYAELLYAETKDPRDLTLAAEALVHAGNGDDLVRLIDEHPFLRDRSVSLLRNYGWQLFRLGRLKDAKEIAEHVRQKFPNNRDLQLEIAIALDTGEWETISGPLVAVLEQASKLDGLTLIRAAHLAQASGQGPMMDLAMSAVGKDEHDPNVLLGAYFLFVEEGLEEQRPEARDWFQKALVLSGPEGPLHAVELKELIAKQTAWNEHTRSLQEDMTRGDLPLAVASKGFRTTIVDVVLRNLIRNGKLVDGRRKSAIPLFAGRRPPEKIGAISSIALDVTALLVLGWLGLLPKVCDAFARIILPGGLLTELFDGRRRIRQAQRSRLRKATEIRDAIAAGKLKVLRSPNLARDALSSEVGSELAALLREAGTGVVLRPAPVEKVDLEERGEADMSGYADCLCDMHNLLRVLGELGVIDEETEQSAKGYFNLQDKGWPFPANPDPARPIFVDGLSLTYLQYTGLLQVFLQTFKNAYIHSSTQEETTILIEHDQNVSEVLRVLDDIRHAVRRANASGKVVFGPRRVNAADQDNEGFQSTLNLFTDLKGADAIIVDDRALNKGPIATDERAHRARMLSSLDVIEELAERGAISEEQYRSLRYRLRMGGAMLVPVTPGEVLAAAKRNQKNEAPEFRAIHDNFDLARLSEMPQFPTEMRWFMSYVHAIKGAVMQVWNEEADEERARSIASVVFSMRPIAEDWVSRWNETPPPGWIEAVRPALIGGYALPFEIVGKDKVQRYQRWLEESVMAEIRELSPNLYTQVVAYLRRFVLMRWEDDDAEEVTGH